MSFDLQNWLESQSGCAALPLTIHDLAGLSTDDRREWLVTNGLGSYASGALNGANTRRYHGLLLASLTPPVRRTLLLSHLDETITAAGVQSALATNYWQSGMVAPTGYTLLESFSNLPCPTWSYRLPAGRLLKQVTMVAGVQSVYIGYTWLPDDGKTAADLNIAVLINYRDFHNQTRGADDWLFGQEQNGDRQVTIRPYDIAQSFILQVSSGAYKTAEKPSWYRDYHWPRERERGLAESEDNFHAGNVRVTLAAGQSLTVLAGIEAPLATVPAIADVVKAVAAAHKTLLEKAQATALPPVVQKLVLAADQFVAHRESTGSATIIAGYHWFSDWGRDSMISLPGLCLSTGRPELAKGILETFGKYLSEGMLPNYFPDGGQEPEYNTSDATLWWASALYRYYQATGDKDFVRLQLPLLQEVIDWHIKGTRHGLKLDGDGLVTGGGPDVQLTWMDAKCGNFVVTPRSGKAVEISALWHNFLRVVEYLRAEVGLAAPPAQPDASATVTGFEKFWQDGRGYLADVIRQDGSVDESLRPNQLMAASLPYPILSQARARSVVAAIEAKLLTPAGLRTLSPDHPDYQGLYGTGLAVADQYHRDITYHQGTVWPWLLGPWVDARLYAFGATEENFAAIRAHLQAILAHIENDGCVGSVSEIFDGDAPHKAQGCVAQAWSIAELLRVLKSHPQLATK